MFKTRYIICNVSRFVFLVYNSHLRVLWFHHRLFLFNNGEFYREADLYIKYQRSMRHNHINI